MEIGRPLMRVFRTHHLAHGLWRIEEPDPDLLL